MAETSGLSRATVSRIWREFALKPHRSETFKLSRDPLFIEKVRDIVRLYLTPAGAGGGAVRRREVAVRTLDRTQPVLPLRPGSPAARTRDYRRNGVTSLFAALNTATGEVLGKCYRKHRSVEFKKLSGLIDKAVREELEVHLVLDNYGTHKTALIHNWLARRPRLRLHFTPPAPRESIRWSAGSPRSRGSRSAAARSVAR